MTSMKGVPRVVWRRLRKSGEEGIYDSIPVLSVSRSLGDFWSFNPITKCFTVSPKPDVHVHPLNLKEQRFIVIASDGLWKVMSPDEVVKFIWDYDKEFCKPRGVIRSIMSRTETECSKNSNAQLSREPWEVWLRFWCLVSQCNQANS